MADSHSTSVYIYYIRIKIKESIVGQNHYGKSLIDLIVINHILGNASILQRFGNRKRRCCCEPNGLLSRISKTKDFSQRGQVKFLNGFFHTIYLSPRDYHRVHMPFDGKLQRMIHVPGRLFSVSPYTVRQVPDLFSRNERVISLFETSHGPMSVILVGAMLVSSMQTVWSGVVTPPRGRKITVGDWSRRDIELKKGQEMGRFNMGSTVIVLLPPGAVSTIEHFESGDDVVMGQKLGRMG